MIVGVMRTVSVVRGDEEPFSGNVGVRKISGRLTTESEPSVRGCSGSEMGEMRSTQAESASHASSEGWSYRSNAAYLKAVRYGDDAEKRIP